MDSYTLDGEGVAIIMSDIIKFGKPIKQVGEGVVKEPLRMPFKYDPRNGLLSLEDGVNTDFSIKNGFKNTVINGDFQIWQRGTSFGAGGYTADRWRWLPTGAGTATVQQSTDTPSADSLWSLQVDVTGADTSIAAGDLYHMRYIAEGYDVRRYIGKTFTLSFWVKSPKSGVHCVAFRNVAPDRSYICEYTINSPNTWEKKSVTVDGGLITAGTWDWINGAGLLVSFVLAAGTTFQTTSDAWQVGSYLATANQVNCMDSTANNFYLSQVQLELGEVATDFERRPIGLELELCQRYFYRWTPEGVALKYLATVQAYTTLRAFGTLLFLPVEMRVIPTASVSSAAHFVLYTAAAAQNAVTAISFATNINTPRAIGSGEIVATAATLVAGNASVFASNNASAWIQADADF